MKNILMLLFAILTATTTAQTPEKLGIDAKPTKYEPGFEYTTNHGEKATLIKWVYVGDSFNGVEEYRWRVLVEKGGFAAVVWTDDCWIDVSIGKAYLDEKQHKIIYYEEK